MITRRRFIILNAQFGLAVAGSSLYAANTAVTAVARENLKPGSDRWRLRQPAVPGELEGYASATSVGRGESIGFFVNTTAASYTLEIFRLGWYGGARGTTDDRARTAPWNPAGDSITASADRAHRMPLDEPVHHCRSELPLIP